MSKIKMLTKTELDMMLEPSGYNYVAVSDLKAGDRLRWWDQDGAITSVRRVRGNYVMKIIDPMDGKEKEFRYSPKEEFLVNQTHLN